MIGCESVPVASSTISFVLLPVTLFDRSNCVSADLFFIGVTVKVATSQRKRRRCSFLGMPPSFFLADSITMCIGSCACGSEQSCWSTSDVFRGLCQRHPSGCMPTARHCTSFMSNSTSCLVLASARQQPFASFKAQLPGSKVLLQVLSKKLFRSHYTGAFGVIGLTHEAKRYRQRYRMTDGFCSCRCSVSLLRKQVSLEQNILCVVEAAINSSWSLDHSATCEAECRDVPS